LPTVAVAGTQPAAIAPAVTSAAPPKIETGPVIKTQQQTNIWLWVSVF